MLWEPEQRARDRSPTRSALARGSEARRADAPGTANPVVVTVAVTGADVFARTTRTSRTRPRRSPTRRSRPRGAGATVAHLHVREDDGTPERPPGAVRRRRSSGSAPAASADDGLDRRRQRHDDRGATTGLEAKPDISGVESGSMNFGDETFITPPPAGAGSSRARPGGIALEVEAFDVGHVVSAVRWLERGSSRRRCASTSSSASRRHRRLARGLEAMLARCRRTRSGPSPASAATTSGLLAWPCFMARRHRTGLEDVAYISRGVFAPSNAALVEMAPASPPFAARSPPRSREELLRVG